MTPYTKMLSILKQIDELRRDAKQLECRVSYPMEALYLLLIFGPLETRYVASKLGIRLRLATTILEQLERQGLVLRVREQVNREVKPRPMWKAAKSMSDTLLVLDRYIYPDRYGVDMWPGNGDANPTTLPVKLMNLNVRQK